MKALSYSFAVMINTRGELDFAVTKTEYTKKGRGIPTLLRLGKCTRPHLPHHADEFADFVLYELAKAGPGHPTLPLAPDRSPAPGQSSNAPPGALPVHKP